MHKIYGSRFIFRLYLFLAWPLSTLTDFLNNYNVNHYKFRYLQSQSFSFRHRWIYHFYFTKHASIFGEIMTFSEKIICERVRQKIGTVNAKNKKKTKIDFGSNKIAFRSKKKSTYSLIHGKISNFLGMIASRFQSMSFHF